MIFVCFYLVFKQFTLAINNLKEALTPILLFITNRSKHLIDKQPIKNRRQQTSNAINVKFHYLE